MHSVTVRHILFALMTIMVFFLPGCGPSWYRPYLYNWPPYWQAMKKEALNPENFDKVESIQSLSTAISNTNPAIIPPGMCMHLAYLMASAGMQSESRAMIEKEAQLFPESGTWIHRLLPAERTSDKQKR